jgi:hypothetical protein
MSFSGNHSSGNDAASLGIWFLMFQDNAVVSSLGDECPKEMAESKDT